MKIFPLWLFAFCSLPLFAFGQGPLTPPAAPTPTMKTLDQIEARTPIPGPVVGLVPPFVINQSGSYYLTKNIAVTSGDAILISANDVTLDLNGFTISSSASPASGTAIKVASGFGANLTIQNGFISGTTTFSGSTFSGGGFSTGISTSTPNVTAERISVRGIGGTGMNFDGANGVVRSCRTNVTRFGGIIAEVITDSIVEVAGGTAIDGNFVSACRGSTVSVGTGINAQLCIDSIGSSFGGTGLSANNAANCYGSTSSTSATVFGLDCSGTATSCRGQGGGGSSVALRATIAIGCTFSNGTATITNRYNMP